METMIMGAPCNIQTTEVYTEGMVTEDAKTKKKTNDIIAG